MTNKELEIQGCKVFVCPNLKMIYEKGNELLLSEITTKKAEDLAVRYFKKTYHTPKYTSAKFLLPAFIYIASIFESQKKGLEHERRTQREIAAVFGITESVIRKWYSEITNELNIKVFGNATSLRLTWDEYDDESYINKY